MYNNNIDPNKIKEDILNSLNSPIVKALNEVGITPSYLANKLKEEMNATQIKVFQHQGEIVESKALPALEIQQKARMDAHKLLDHYPVERHQVDSNIVFDVVNYAKHKDNIDKE